MKRILLILAMGMGVFQLSAQMNCNGTNCGVPNSFYVGHFGDSSYRMRFYNNSSYSIFDYQPDLYFRGASTNGLNYPTRVIFKVSGQVGIATTTPSYLLHVNGTAGATSFVTISDSRLKQNVSSITGVLSKLVSLKGVTYNYTKETRQVISPIDGKVYEERVVNDETDKKHMGFLAQDVQKVFPESVHTSDDGYLGIDYGSLIPAIVEAMKEQQATISSLQTEIEDLKSQLQKTPNTISKLGTGSMALYQNYPNPFNESTHISYTLPDNVKNAVIIIYDMNGKQLMILPQSQRGDVDITIEGGQLQAGIYIYTLIADGNVVGTKKMILTQE